MRYRPAFQLSICSMGDRPRYDLAGSASDCLSQTTFAARRILGMAHYCSARAFAVNPARLKARPLRARGLTAQRGQATAPPCQEWNRVRPNGGTEQMDR